MSEENLEAVRAIYERFSEGDFSASVDLFDRHIVFLMMSDAPGPRSMSASKRSRRRRVGFLTRGQI